MSRFRRAYANALRGGTTRVAEPAEGEACELAWQARWFSGACGREFTTTAGEKAVITDFGEWNREAGPDFVRAAVRLGGREHRGAIEVDLEASGWEQHRHALNTAYEDVVLHVVVNRSSRRHFSRTASHREVPQVCLADHPPGAGEWDASGPARPGRCAAPLRILTDRQLAALLATAAERRLESKAAALQAMIAARGSDAALYECLAVALGYKSNKLPFRLLAQRVPRRRAAGRRGEALLFGLAGFLERPAPGAGAARSQATALWSAWWKLRAGHAQAVLPPRSWSLAGLRPANHPLRRIAALAAAAREWRSVREALESGDLARLDKTLGGLKHGFWSFHTSWDSPRRPAPLALIGPDRIREIHANISLPLALARGEALDWMNLAAASPNGTLRVVSARLFGPGPARRLPRRLFVQQGLLQVYADFCLKDRGECATCRFPSLVAGLPA